MIAVVIHRHRPPSDLIRGLPMQTGSYTTLFIILGSAALIVLLALTLRSVIRRDKAMIETKPDDAAYEERWRKKSA